MKIYRVGGAVRDKYLNLPITEQDWLVVGATAEQLLAKGYQRVGKDFPVFLHPTTKEEYALARTERKSGSGYTGFIFTSDASVTLEDDLMRRDLTINAMAEDENGNLYDPYHGLTDLKNKLLRHVSPAFMEDPVRILRIARFSARFSQLGFTIATETEHLMKQMVENGEINALVAERIWQELQRALTEKNPGVFFDVLQRCGALEILFPELASHFKIILTHLACASRLTTDPKIRFAALISSLSEVEIKSLCERYRIPTDYKDLSVLTQRNLHLIDGTFTAETLLHFFEKTDAFRRPERWDTLVLALHSIGLSEHKKNILTTALATAKTITVKTLCLNTIKGSEIGDHLHTARLNSIQSLLELSLK